ncbi:MAG: Bax inhibitor-1/YccA family protein [Myxococcales bacterium]|nr:Bax inhibitor-1/YccA family protein [Myxococcales bacterium]
MGWGTGARVSQTSEADLVQSERRFMGGVYNWMILGLALTGGTAWIVATTPAILQAIMPFFLPLIFAQLGLVLLLGFLITKMSPMVAGLTFLGYSLLTGVTFSSIFLAYQIGSIANVFLLCAVMFGGLSLYGTVTKRNLSAWGGFLFMGLFGLIGAMLLNFFLKSPGLDFVISAVAVVVFAGLTAYDTQKLRLIHRQAVTEGGIGVDSPVMRKVAIFGALTLYLDFINLFLHLLHFLGKKR